MTSTPKHSRNPAPSSSLGGSSGQALSSSLRLSAPFHRAERAYREAQTMPAWKHPPRKPKRHPLDRFDLFCAITALISIAGIAAHIWGN